MPLCVRHRENRSTPNPTAWQTWCEKTYFAKFFLSRTRVHRRPLEHVRAKRALAHACERDANSLWERKRSYSLSSLSFRPEMAVEKPRSGAPRRLLVSHQFRVERADGSWSEDWARERHPLDATSATQGERLLRRSSGKRPIAAAAGATARSIMADRASTARTRDERGSDRGGEIEGGEERRTLLPSLPSSLYLALRCTYKIGVA